MSSKLRKIQKKVQRQKSEFSEEMYRINEAVAMINLALAENKEVKEEIPDAPVVWAYMRYVCENCGRDWKMYLENTLERHGKNGTPHKPVPFGIRCPYCGGFHAFDRSGLMEIPLRFLRPGEDYFKDTPGCDCGKPVYCWKGN